MTDLLFEQAWRVAEELRSRVDLIDGTRATPGMMANLAADLSMLAVQLRPAFRKANLTSDLDLLESRIGDLRSSSRDLHGIFERLHSTVVGMHMSAYSIAHPPNE